MGQNRDGAIGLGIIAVIIVIIVGVVVWAMGPGETKPAEQDRTADTQELSYMERFAEKENVVLDLVKDYSGKDGSGLTLAEVIAMSILVEYPGEDILKNPSTDLGWSALPISGDPDTDTSWDVKFYLNTYKESVSYEWTVDMETKSIYPKNESGKDLLDMLND